MARIPPLEPISLYLIIIIGIGIINLFEVPFFSSHISLVAMTLFLYLPMISLARRGCRPHDIGIWPLSFKRAVLWTIISALILFPIFILGHWILHALIMKQVPVFKLPAGFHSLILFHILGVSFPEEFFYRGYMQSVLNDRFPQRWKFLGARMGPSMIITAFLFSLGHLTTLPRWWRLGVFFPGLVFGWLREKTDGILAPVLFHALCNILIISLDGLYR